MTTNDDIGHRSLFSCQVAVSDMAPDSDVKKWTGGRGCECSPGHWPLSLFIEGGVEAHCGLGRMLLGPCRHLSMVMGCWATVHGMGR